MCAIPRVSLVTEHERTPRRIMDVGVRWCARGVIGGREKERANGLIELEDAVRRKMDGTSLRFDDLALPVLCRMSGCTLL